MATKHTIKDNSGSSRTFDYTLKNCVLRFTLRVDMTDELITYQELMKRGLADIEGEIKRLQALRKKK